MEVTGIYDESGLEITKLESLLVYKTVPSQAKPQATSTPVRSTNTVIDGNSSMISDYEAFWNDFDSSLAANTMRNDEPEEALDEEWLIEVADAAAAPAELKEADIEMSNLGIAKDSELNLYEEPGQPLAKTVDVADEENVTVPCSVRLLKLSKRNYSEISNEPNMNDSILRRSKRHSHPPIEYWTNAGRPRKPLVLTFFEPAKSPKLTEKQKKIRAKCRRADIAYERYLSRINKTV